MFPLQCYNIIASYKICLINFHNSIDAHSDNIMTIDGGA